MTRINTLPVDQLTDQHLIAEYREITRLPKNLHKSLNRKSKPFSYAEIPPEYVLGKGHVKFFFDKFEWLEKRFNSLLEECKRRGFTTNFNDVTIFRNVPSEFYGDWKITDKSLALCKQRILERINSKPKFYKYYGRKL